jgi:hypothetical protein
LPSCAKIACSAANQAPAEYLPLACLECPISLITKELYDFKWTPFQGGTNIAQAIEREKMFHDRVL